MDIKHGPIHNYVVEFGIHGAYTIKRREFTTLLEAEQKARRWSESNSTGHYWAEVTRNDKVVTSFNLKRR